MAKLKGMNGAKLVIKFGDGLTPEIFTAKCIINTSRGIAFNSNVIETQVPDCDNLEAPTFIEIDIDGLSATITGNGTCNTPDIAFFRQWWLSGAAKNIQVAMAVDLADGGGWWYFAAKLPSWDLTGPDLRAKSTFTCTIRSSGEIGWTDA